MNIEPVNVVAIIQARTASTRLPGKVLSEIAGRSMLAHVCRRVRRAATVGRLVVATTDRPADDAIVDECRRLGAGCYRGSEQDVLDRYGKAASANGAGAIVRVTSDCPLIDPEVIDRVVRLFLQHRPDYASNTLQRSWPRGLDTEVIGADALERACREATRAHHREHVTPYIYEHPESFRLLPVTADEDHSDGRWTVDTPEDLAFVRAVFRAMGSEATFCWRDVQQLLKRRPEIARINRHVRQKRLAQG